MSDIRHKIEEFRKKYPMSIPEFAQGAHLHLQVAYNTINGKTKPREQTIKEIEQFMKKYSEENDKITNETQDEDINSIINKLKAKIHDKTGLNPSKIDIVFSY
ncbi:helix-turn-helix transcriptional regulator [Acetobacter sp. TBRC 12305]|uniref:Helix-turn-helix transcriptional regulator n=1 Tax=Acetobacter garciniae TaxID=2817435 RepID=A0A939KS32_9PROT|nr:helix-turn-helix transcriptional regulator [Acetobacter garciniae]MBO1326801.1 helix-turn-helix transcriptional regulator [Acetobacter garciniae]MBX0346546.1 helix-turn-helix transcriptional regulator [Acetobacter garciniae]